jgi:type II secretory pathway component PulF
MSPSKKPESKDVLRDSLRSKLMGEAAPDTESADASASRAKPRAARRARTNEDEPATARGILSTRISFGGPGLTQMAAFCRQLATLIDVGIPLLRSLNLLAQRVEHPKLKKVVADVALRVEQGNSLSDALAAHPTVFSSLIVNVTRIGETGGILDRSLLQLADMMERRSEIRKRMAAAAAYPTAALIVCGLAILVILGFAIPVFKKIYESNPGVALPGVTRFVLGLSGFAQTFWWLIIIVVVAAVWAFRYLLRANPGVRRAWDALKLNAPLIRTLNIQVNVTRSARTLANLLRAGVPLLESLRVAADTSENVVVGDALHKAHDVVEKGGQLETPLRQSGVFPDLVVDMIAVGDEAGKLDVMFDKIAETYDADVNLSIRTMNAVLEPALILVMGAVVLVLALSVLLPYWRLGSVIAGGSEQ